MENEKLCINCGESFTPSAFNPRQKYCSDKCRVRYNNAKRNYGVPVNTCPECGGVVEQSKSSGRWQRFCSDQCRIVQHHRKRQAAQRQNRPRPIHMCPNCGKDFEVEWTPGTQRRFCSDSCRISWWQAYHREHPTEQEEVHCLTCGQEIKSKHHGGKYCSRDCYLVAVGETRTVSFCKWCGKKINTYIAYEQQYCSRSCAVAARHAPKGVHKIRRWPQFNNAADWLDWLKDDTRTHGSVTRSQRVMLVCGETDMHTGPDGLIAIIRYRLKCNPYDGSVYVFRGQTGSMLKYIEWDGTGFCMGKRQAQRGSYPWPTGEKDAVVEINDREFRHLLSRSIPAVKREKGKKSRHRKARIKASAST